MIHACLLACFSSFVLCFAVLEPSLFSQYKLTATGVVSGTGYALYKKPRNGIGIMLVAGAAGSLGDLMYGWVYACKPQVKEWRRQTPPPPNK